MTDVLYRCPAYNVFDTGRVCTGSHEFPSDRFEGARGVLRELLLRCREHRPRAVAPLPRGHRSALDRATGTGVVPTRRSGAARHSRRHHAHRSVTVSMVEYLVARDGVPLPEGLAFDYLLAGDGLYLLAESDLLKVRVPVAGCTVRGLPPVYPACTLKRGRLPAWIWHAIVWAAHVGYTRGREVMLAVTFDPSVGYRLHVPQQVAGPERVVYRPTPNAVLEIHSHGPLAAAFSSIDDRDEQGMRLYGVVGRLGTDAARSRPSSRSVRPLLAGRVGDRLRRQPVIVSGCRLRLGFRGRLRRCRTSLTPPALSRE